jgi:B-type flagellin
MLTINTNLSSLLVQSNLKTSTNGLNTAIERMTTGFKINHAKDNAANFSINTKLSSQISAYQVAETNVLMGLDLVSTAEESLNHIIDGYSRLRELAVNAVNGTNSVQSLEAIKAEAESLLSDIERNYKSCEYNNIKLFHKYAEIDETKRVSKQSSFVSGETYYLSNAKDVVALQNLVNSGVDTTDVKFELARDIDMSGIDFRGIGVDEQNSFKGTFEGCGYVISNLKINTTENNVGLFGCTNKAAVQNVGLENCNVSGGSYTGGLIGWALETNISEVYCIGKVSGIADAGGVIGRSTSSRIQNSYFKGDVIGTTQYAGGFIGRLSGGSFINCYSEGFVQGEYAVGGLVGANYNGAVVKNSFSKSEVIGYHDVGGLVGKAGADVSNSFAAGKVVGQKTVGGLIGYADFGVFSCSCSVSSYTQALGGSNFGHTADMLTEDELRARYTPDVMGFTEDNGWKNINDNLVLSWQKSGYGVLNSKNEVNLQVGVNAGTASNIGFDISFDLGDIGEIFEIGLDNVASLDLIDRNLQMLSQKATEYGTIQNRLQSVVEEITIKYDNLVSTQSTIRDADIAEESCAYIRNQILQQASSTLLATANQTPAIVLQLL